MTVAANLCGLNAFAFRLFLALASCRTAALTASRRCRTSANVNGEVAFGFCVTSIADPNGMHSYTRDEGGPFGFGNRVLISSHRKLLSSKATVVNVAETSGHDPGRYGRERRAQANRR